MYKNKGFTLVELSIVIVIISIIIAGISAGVGVVKQSKILSTISDLNKFNLYINTFVLQYNAMPGDMKNASAYWSGAVDGNGNKKIEESLNVWNHLRLAGFTINASANSYPIPPVNTRGIYRQIFYTSIYSPYGNNINPIVIWPNDYGTWGMTRSLLSAKNSKAIDDKIDDGIPNRGKIMTFSDQPCVLGATYDLSSSITRCALAYILK